MSRETKPRPRPLVVNPDFAADVRAHFGDRRPAMWEVDRFSQRWLAAHPGELLQVTGPDPAVLAAWRKASGEAHHDEEPQVRPNRKVRRTSAALVRPLIKAEARRTAPAVGSLAPALRAKPTMTPEQELEALGAAAKARNARKALRHRLRMQPQSWGAVASRTLRLTAPYPRPLRRLFARAVACWRAGGVVRQARAETHMARAALLAIRLGVLPELAGGAAMRACRAWAAEYARALEALRWGVAAEAAPLAYFEGDA